MPRPESLQSRTIMMGRGRRYLVQTEGLPLSLKCMANGRARYVVERNEFAVDDHGWLIVNEDQPYTIEISSPTELETFIVWFPRGWAEEVWRSATTPAAQLLAEPHNVAVRTGFFERYTPNENAVTPLVHDLRRVAKSGEPLEDAWLEQRLRELLARMLGVQRDLRAAIARLGDAGGDARRIVAAFEPRPRFHPRAMRLCSHDLGCGAGRRDVTISFLACVCCCVWRHASRMADDVPHRAREVFSLANGMAGDGSVFRDGLRKLGIVQHVVPPADRPVAARMAARTWFAPANSQHSRSFHRSRSVNSPT